MATIGALVFEMSANIARLQQDMAKAKDVVTGAMAGIQSAANLAKTALGALGIGASVSAFESMIRGSIDSMNALHELSIRTGVAVEQLSALRGVAKQSGTEMDAVAGLTNKLEKNMADFARGGGGKAKDAFAELGISSTQAKQALESGDIVGFMQNLAGKLMNMESGAQRAAYAQELMGKSGASLLPFLKQLAETGELNAKVTTAQAEAAHQFEVNLVKLQGQSNQLKMQLANALLPSLNDITTAMLDARRAGEGFFGSMFEGAKRATQALMGWNNAGDLAKTNQQIVELTDKWMGLEKIQGTRGVSKERVDGIRAEIDALIKKRDVLEGVIKIEQSGGVTGKKEEKKTVIDMHEKETKVREERLKKQKTLEESLADSALKKAYLEDEIERSAEATYKHQEREAQALKEQLDPLERIRQEIFKIAELRKLDMLTAEQADEMRASANAKADKIFRDMEKTHDSEIKKAKETQSAMQELGFAMISSVENSIGHWQGFRNLLGAIDADIAKVITRKFIVDPLAKAATGALEGSGIGDWFKGIFGGGKASGGSVTSGTPYVVGEAGPELFVPGSGGTIIPNGAAGGGGGGVVHINFNVTAMDASSFNSKLAQSRSLIVGIIQDAYTRNGRASGMAV